MADTRETAHRYCDLVMKGGITSGLVYPNVALELAATYRFKNIGGTSAGAIAAVVCAAAELGERRRTLEPARYPQADIGMAALRSVSGDLAQPHFIYSLFRPTPRGRPVFDLVVGFTHKPGLLTSFRLILTALVKLAWLTMALTLAVLLGLGYMAGGRDGVLAAALPAVLLTLIFGAGRGVLAFAQALHLNFLGLCPGISHDRQPGVTEWMHMAIRRVAGATDGDDRPVVFKDLWTAPAYPDEPDTSGSDAKARRVNLQVLTTDVSHGEPRTIPFERGKFWFRKDEFERLFPASVVKAMIAPDRTKVSEGVTYHEFPQGDALPIVVAARMSLSFPVLISAIPLYELDFSRKPVDTSAPDKPLRKPARLIDATEGLSIGGDTGAAGRNLDDVPLRLVWFSDGGETSNFPIHLFDSALPRWPTFGIELTEAQSDADQPFLPRSNNQGWHSRYSAITGKGPLADLAAFLGAIVNTAMGWRDTMQARAPGYRERIVQVPLTADQGGANLDMPADTLRKVSAKGSAAGKEILAHFSFDNQYWVRYRVAMAAVEGFGLSFAAGLDTPLTDDNRGAWQQVFKDVGKGAPSYKFSDAQAKEALVRVRYMQAEGQRWSGLPAKLHMGDGAPNPLQQLRIVPVF